MAKAEAITMERALDDLRRLPTVPVWPHVAVLLNVSRNGAYEAAHRGDVDTIKIGKLQRAVSSSLRKKLGIEAA